MKILVIGSGQIHKETLKLLRTTNNSSDLLPLSNSSDLLPLYVFDDFNAIEHSPMINKELLFKKIEEEMEQIQLPKESKGKRKRGRDFHKCRHI